MVYYMPLMKVNYPPLVKTVLGKLNLADLNITIPYLNEAFNLLIKENKLKNKPFN